MAAGAQSSRHQKNSLADRKERAAGRAKDLEREKPPVKGAFGRAGQPDRGGSALPGRSAGSGGGTVSKSDYAGVGASRRRARKRKA